MNNSKEEIVGLLIEYVQELQGLNGHGLDALKAEVYVEDFEKANYDALVAMGVL